jgi:competence protein ComEC
MQSPSEPEKIQQAPFQGFLPFFWLSLAALGGIWLADWLAIPSWVWILGFGLSLALWISARALPRAWALTHRLIQWTRADRRLPNAILAAFFFVAGWRYTSAQPEVGPYWIGFYNDRGMVQLVGDVVRPPDPRDTHTNLILRVRSLKLLTVETDAPLPEKISGHVLVQVRAVGEWAYGDQISAEGALETPFESGDFSYRDYLARKGIYSIMPYARVARIAGGGGSKIKSWLYNLRDESRVLLDDFFPSPESDLLAGILLGLDQGLSPHLQAAFQKTGTTHIIAISGFNMTILAGLFTSVFTRFFGRRWGALTAIAGITLYALFVGGEAAVVRAAIMGGLGVMGGMFGRRQTGLNSLGLAVFGMILIDPNLPWDIGFQLSAAATLGLVLYAQPLEEKALRWLGRWLPEEKAQKIMGPLSELFLFTLAAQVMTLPIIAYHFGGLSWLTFLANPLVLPPQPLVLILGGMALLVGLILPGLGRVIALTALPFVRYTIRVVSWLGGLPVEEIVLSGFHPLWLLVFYAVLFFLTLIPKERQKVLIKKFQPAYVGLLALTGLTFFVWTQVLNQPDDRLHLTLLDGEGTVLVQSPGGGLVLIGGGSSPSHLKQVLGERLPIIRPKVDWVVAASPAQADLNALLGGIAPDRVERVLWGVDPSTNQTSRGVYLQFQDPSLPIVEMAEGHTLDLGDGILLEVLSLEDKGALLWLAWDNFSALIPAGKVEGAWLKLPGAPDVILLPDDTAVAGLPPSKLNVWAPSAILLPLKDSDRPIQGEQDLIKFLEGYPLLNTLDNGWVKVSTDGSQLWVETER